MSVLPLPISWTPVQTCLVIFYRKGQQDGQREKVFAAKPSALVTVATVKYMSHKLENFGSDPSLTKNRQTGLTTQSS